MASPTKTIQIKTETERALANYYEREREERLKLQALVLDLQQQIDELQNKLRSNNRYSKNNTDNEVPPPPVQYETDEEELARETEWVRQKNRKKRKLNTSRSPQQVEDCGQSGKDKPKVRKPPLPPPIVVEGIEDYQKFYDFLLESVAKDTFIVKILNRQAVKVNVNCEDSYRAITKALRERHCLWHSYENKQERPIRVVAKNLSLSCSPDRIAEDLILKGYKILNAVNKRSWKNKQPLNMFILSFQKDEDINKIYSIKSILGCKVDIQPIKTSKLIPQCKRCQAYGHTQKYCSKEPRCVKCTDKHLTKECNKPPEAKPKCIHCGEPHPANYRGCIVAKELQHMKNKLVKGKKNMPSHVTQAPNSSKLRPANVNRDVVKNISYAQITKGAQAEPSQLKENPILGVDEKLNKILHMMTLFDERLKKLESSTKITTSNKTRND